MRKISYAIGMNIAANLKQQGAKDIDAQAVVDGMKAVLEGKPTEITGQEAGQLLNKYFTELEENQNARIIEDGRAFLAANGERAEVTVLKSGLQYEIMREGNGRKPKATDRVSCHYHGTLIDGTVFDSSVQRGEPATFPVNGVIQGWVEALQLMPVGSKWKLYIPYNLGYGARGAGSSIPPYATLIFEVELLDIL
ncbi:MAG: FKBP-type peptidyl-prolyl cis-trans isomerase [Marinilabiliaceae bacterium]|jgi:FKBP-type peptidyl-prolyl cis-trans isomerase FklB|nr:FKBP-type peptidyl-prolyl cis-trans isomerase [Bacteroidales bacterium]MCR5696483.1 FKBP-type peptidyl-prolyl cis-trans isomerase [Marinilabiliaceae bacterium]